MFSISKPRAKNAITKNIMDNTLKKHSKYKKFFQIAQKLYFFS